MILKKQRSVSNKVYCKYRNIFKFATSLIETVFLHDKLAIYKSNIFSRNFEKMQSKIKAFQSLKFCI